ncbi:MAG: Mov34/MPN/PAD-1 family protein [Planctomycetes bacterium]|nr:Mov34/MPN/PAD-1 family protein [Planctomycetota bacterium]
MVDRHFRSPDKRFGVQISEAELAKVVKQCFKAGRKETGGILVGRYTAAHDCAVVTSASDAPQDSHAGGTWFSRGVAGLQRWLNGLWKSETFYLGEWHFHPFALASPSVDDLAEMRSISTTESYHCPEPLLMIVGGDPKKDWHIKVFVFLAYEGLRELPEVKAGGSAPNDA